MSLIRVLNNQKFNVLRNLSNSYYYSTTTSSSNSNSIDWNKRWSVTELLENKQKSHRIPEEKLRHLASLSMIDIKDEEVDKYCQQLGDVLHAVDAMQQVDTTNVQPMRTVLENQSLLLRKENTDSNSSNSIDNNSYSNQILEHSSHTLSSFYTVPHRSSSGSTSNKLADNDDLEEI